MVCQCKCIERHMQSNRSVLEDDETRGRSVLSLSLLVIVIKRDEYECEMSRTIRLHRCQAKTTRFMVAATVESGAFDIRK